MVTKISAVLILALSACAGPRDGGGISARRMAAGPAKVGELIMVDQFGYRPADPKVAVLVDPQQGFNAAESYSPGETFEVRRWSDGQVVHSGKITPFEGGATQASSGDRGWWFDFSSVTTPGSYYLFDPQNKLGSHRFEIDEHVYREVLKAATRMYFYNRCGAAKQPPHADPRWQDGASYLGPGQDGEARPVDDKDNAAAALDLRGGWFDAGDTNKYVTFAESPVHDLLTAFEENPDPWTDDFNIPESGNGIPDVLDEIKWEVDWIKRMQRPDGGVLIKVGVLDHSEVTPPSADERPRYYAPKCSSSTIVAAGIFAHAALVYANQPKLAGEVADLQQRAEQAWQWYHANPKRSDCDSQEIKAGDADRDPASQEASAVVAAAYLFALTGQAKYDDHFKANYNKARPYNDIGWSRYSAYQGDALLFYAGLAQGDPATSKAILDHKRSDASSSKEIYGEAAMTRDLYRAYITDATYHWGSNHPRAANGSTNVDMIVHGLDPSGHDGYRARALGVLHYFHGVNPLGMVYLSNMGGYGAEVSASEIYHTWFVDGSDWDSALTSPKGPAPGFVPGGPNAAYSGPTSPPAGQPRQKTYRDWNTVWPDASWEITEPGIYYQAAYVRLLSKFVGAPSGQPVSDGGSPPGGDGSSTRDGGVASPADGGSVVRDGGGTSAAGDGGGEPSGGGAEGGCRYAATDGAGGHGVLLVLALLALARRRG